MRVERKEKARRSLATGSGPETKGGAAPMARNPIIREPYPEVPADQENRGEPNCFYCLSGWVFLGSIGHDGEEIVEAIRCCRCNGTGRIENH